MLLNSGNDQMTGCLSWYYHMKGSGIGNLTLYRRIQSKSPIQLTQLKGEQGTNWLQAKLTLPTMSLANQYFDLIFEATIGSNLFGNIAIDDIEFTPRFSCEYLASTTQGPMTSTTIPPVYKELKCTFDNGNLCGWYAEASRDIAWVRQNSDMAQYGTSPLNDVSLQSSLGYYAYLNLRSALKLETVVLKSPTFPGTGGLLCFDFWYQMNAPRDTGLSVLLGTPSNRTVLWQRKGNMADTWTHAYVTIPANDATDPSEPRWVEFNGDISYDYKGFLAVDDVELLLGECPAQKFCDFEVDMCSFVHDLSGDFKWSRNKGKTGSFDTGPPFDHTYQTPEGYYMYIETSYPQKTGELIGPNLNLSKELKFDHS